MVVDVRRLVAVDMHGSRGSVRRRRVIRAEFVAGVIGCLALGTLALLRGQGWMVVLGGWLISIGINYVPLALAANALSRPGALERELAGADLPEESRRVGVQQLWILVPFAIVIAAARS